MLNSAKIITLQNLEDKEENTISIGNSFYTDDIWDMEQYMQDVTLKSGAKKLRFDVFATMEYRKLMKKYAYYKLGRVKPRTVIGYVNGCFPTFFHYCEEQNIYSLINYQESDMLDFVGYLKEEKHVSERTGYTMTSVLEELFRIGREKGWEVPREDVFALISSRDIWKRNRQIELNKTQPIPDKIFDQILDCAINRERFGLTSAGIIIQSQTGLRINEVLSLTEGCIEYLSDGTAYMNVTISKTERGDAINHKILVNELVVNTVKNLEALTRLLREESGRKELFLTKYQVIRTAKGTEWTGRRLKAFMKRHNIRDDNGEIYSLASHQFRATFVKNLIKKNVPLTYIKKHFAHVSIEMTAHYLTLKNDEVQEMYTSMILGKESKLAGIRAGEIRKKLDCYFQGKTESEIEEAMATLAKTLSYNPLPNGVCLYDFRRGNCTDGDGCFFYNCPNYVTEARYYPVLKKELEVLELEMQRLKELGRERDWQRQYVKHQYLKPLVEQLEEQINE
jgi:integrase